jgi:erythromycin esterase
MFASSHPNPFADRLRGHAVPLTHLDPAAPLDDLEPLRDIIGNARVVAVGEHSHFIDEFTLMRRRILRFLVERCGFTVLALEYGFSEGLPLDAWAQGEGTDDDLSAHLAAAIPVGLDEPLRWIRRHNRTAAQPVRFAGIDIPAAGGSLLPALAPIADYLRQVDPETLPAVQTALRIAESFAGGSAAVAAPAWARLATAELEPPEPGSVEAAFADAGLGLGIADLRRTRRGTSGGAGHVPGPDRIRMQSTYVHTPVLDAFDGILNTPTSTVADDIDF